LNCQPKFPWEALHLYGETKNVAVGNHSIEVLLVSV
jgi:hypothetical protein